MQKDLSFMQARWLPFFAFLAALLALSPTPAGAVQGPAAVFNQAPSMAVIHAEPVAVSIPGPIKGPQEQLFLYVAVTYPGSRLLYFDPHNIVLHNNAGVNYYTGSYSGTDKLTAKEMIRLPGDPPASESGWLLFTVAVSDAVSLRLLYKETGHIPGGGSGTYVAAASTVFTPQRSAKRDYAAAAQPLLLNDLLDEAVGAGYLRLSVAPLYANGGNGPVPGDALVLLRRQVIRLDADRRAFDAVPALGPTPLRYKADADAAFAAIAVDLDAAATVRDSAGWTAWYGAFQGHDKALADVYDAWPGPQIDAALQS